MTKGARPRDGQRAKVREAEKVLAHYRSGISYDEVVRIVRRVWKSKKAQKKWPKAIRTDNRPYVYFGDGYGTCYGTEITISHNAPDRTMAASLRHLAVLIVAREVGTNVAWHGWEMCQTYLTLVRWIMGKIPHDTLKASFRQHNIRFSPPRTRQPLSPERKKKMQEHLEHAREIRRKKNYKPTMVDVLYENFFNK